MGISPQQFESMKNRLSATKRAAVPVFQSSGRPLASALQVIIGVDPSLRGTGYGLIKLRKPHPETLAHGTIACPVGWEHSRCLVKIAQTLRDIIKQYHPTVCVVEGLFFAQNLQTALTMGEARGACLVAAAEAGLEIAEYSPNHIKKCVVGAGHAGKDQVQFMVKRLLPTCGVKQADAADALAAAITHAHLSGTRARMNMVRA